MFKEMSLFKSPLKFWVLLGIVLQLTASVFSEGFIHWDEYFQQIEFMNAKLGQISFEALPWEYATQMRPWFQPFIYFWIVKFWKVLSIENPFWWTFCFRFLSSLLGMAATLVLSEYCFRTFKEEWKKKWSLILLNTLWFFPLIHARLSAEGFGTSLFALGLGLFLLKNKEEKSFFYALFLGLLFGLALEVRYQIGIMVLFLGLWSLIFKQEKPLSFLAITLGIIIAMGLCASIDYWGYGNFTLPWLNYLKENIFNDKASNYGTSPWWHYFSLVFSRGPAPLGILFIFSTLFFWIKKPLHYLTWISLPFFVLHCLIAHKELRFLFPLTFFLPFFIIEFISVLPKFLLGRTGKILLALLVATNTLWLIYASTQSQNNYIPYFKHTYSMPTPIKEIHIVDDINPYFLNELQFSFYNFHHPDIKRHATYNDLLPLLKSSSFSFWVFTSRTRDYFLMKDHKECQLDYLSLPSWAVELSIFKRSKSWALFICEKL